MQISSAIFEGSAPDLSSCPDELLPEFAFIGRSNVGKSSLLNLLAGREALARVSPTPGFTKLINHFTINHTWRLVDLPGYGYAQVAREDSDRFNHAVLDYLERRQSLCLVFALIDSGLPPQAIDLEFVQWLVSNSVPFVLVFTKTDKVSSDDVHVNMTAFMARIAAWFATPPACYTCSAKTGQGKRELLGVIEETLAAIKAEARQAAVTYSEPASKPRPQKSGKRRPDLNRPW